MNLELFEKMDAAGLRRYLEFLLWHYRVVDSFWFISVAERFGQTAAELSHDLPGGLVQVPGAGIVAQPFPQLEHIVERRGGQRLDGGKTFYESSKIWYNCNHLRLLQHDLADPDAIGVGTPAAARALTALCWPARPRNMGSRRP